MTDDLAAFDQHRRLLFTVAYQMLGSVADAEDVVQDAWLRWSTVDRVGLRSAEAWLVTVVTRLAIDRLRSSKSAREAYVGQWLPEPLVGEEEDTPESLVGRAGDVSVAFLHVLERLGPDERAAFLLREVFDYDYGEIAVVLAVAAALTAVFAPLTVRLYRRAG